MKVKKFASVYILVDNLNVGGIQRLSMDESYWLKANNFKNSILVLGESTQETTIINIDSNYFKMNKIEIIYLGKSKATQFYNMVKTFRETSKNTIVVSHSAGGTPLIFLSRIFTFKKIKVFLWIHQAITLSGRSQAHKRLFYSLFASKLFFGARHFQEEWIDFVKRSFWKFLYFKRGHFDRIGVYLPRVFWSGHDEVHFCENLPLVSHVIFASRMSGWKGFEKFREICSNLIGENIHSIVMRIGSKEDHFSSPEANDFEHSALNVSPSVIYTNSSLVHFYPTNYGEKVRYPQSIGLNVLEFLALGVPSLISQESFLTFPELQDSLLIYIVDWESLSDVKISFEKAKSLETKDRMKEAERLSAAVSIERHMNRIVEEFARDM